MCQYMTNVNLLTIKVNACNKDTPFDSTADSKAMLATNVVYRSLELPTIAISQQPIILNRSASLMPKLECQIMGADKISFKILTSSGGTNLSRSSDCILAIASFKISSPTPSGITLIEYFLESEIT